MSMKVYGAILSPFVRKTRVVLALKGIEYQPVHVDPDDKPKGYFDISPLGRIPALELDDGRCLADSAVICAYLERIHPETPLYPQDPYDYARALWFEKYADYEISTNCTFAVFRNRIVMRLMGRESNEEAARAAIEKKIPALFSYLDNELKGKQYLVADQMTVADVALASQLVNYQHAGETVDAAQYPNLAAHRDRMHALEPFAKTIAKEAGLLQKMLG